MQDNDKSNITIGLPNESGALYWAPAGTALPTDATTALDPTKFVNLGFVTEDGITHTVAEDGDDVIVWGKEVVMHSQTGYARTATFNLIESARIAVLQFLYGSDNVTVGGDGTVTWDETGEPLPRGVLVCDTLQNNGDAPRFKRQVLGDAQFTDRSGDHVYNNSDPLSYPIALTAYKFADAGGKRVYSKNYLSAVTTTTTTTTTTV